MNNVRRTQLKLAIEYLLNAGEIIALAAEEEQSSLENLPSQFQQKIDMMLDTVCNLEEIADGIEQAIITISEM